MLKKIFIIVAAACFTCIVSYAQKDTCKFVLFDTLKGADTVAYYLAANANQWNPADSLFKFKKNKDGSNYFTAVFNKATHLEFKFTKGSWDNVECNKDGNDINNHIIKTDTARVNTFYIQYWKNDFPSKPKSHTASVNVHIIDTAFYIPQLKRARRVWIYLPDGYATNGKGYPVLYMQDGQDVFDSYTSANGEWGVDECLDTLIKKGVPACIVVAIDCGPERGNEYDPYYSKRFGEGEGDAYVNFLLHTLKPYIDNHYRTLQQPENTLIAGSSLGALISYYAVLKHPDIFGKAGIFSPAFWIAPEIKHLTDSLANKFTGKIFFYAGKKEGDDPSEMTNEMMDVENRLNKTSRATIKSALDEQGEHNEKAWRKWFPVFYEWIMKSDK